MNESIYTKELMELKEAYSNLIKILYSRHGAGGMLHILTDDGNAEDRHVEWLREYIKPNPVGDPPWLIKVQELILDIISIYPEDSEERLYIESSGFN